MAQPIATGHPRRDGRASDAVEIAASRRIATIIPTAISYNANRLNDRRRPSRPSRRPTYACMHSAPHSCPAEREPEMVALFTDADPAPPAARPQQAARSVVGSLHDETRTPCQDVHSVATVATDHAPTHIYIVLDGHGPRGDHVAALAARTLSAALPPLLAKRATYDSLAARHHAALRAAFAKTAELVDSDPAAAASGTTATVVLVQARVLTVANIGDSAAVVARAGRTAQLLSVDHRATNDAERRRVLAAGGIIDFGYVCDANPPTKMISVTRAFGDLDVRSIGVLSAPDIASFVLEDRDFFILATDGLWDAHGGITPQRAVDVLSAYLRKDDNAGVEGAVDELISMARGRYRFPFDDATVVVVFPRLS